jgi:hypothetical protein
MALAIYFEELIASGQVSSQAELARLGKVTRASDPDHELARTGFEHPGADPRMEDGLALITDREVRAGAQMPNWQGHRRSRVLVADL